MKNHDREPTAPEALKVTPAARPAEIKAVPVRHPGRWVASLIVAVLMAMFVHGLVAEKGYGWGVAGQYFLPRRVLDGLVLTIEFTVIAMAIGIALGIVLAVMRLSPNPLVSGRAGCTSGFSAVPRCWCSCCSGRTWPRSTRGWGSAFRSGRSS
jgi:hypothetical protein